MFIPTSRSLKDKRQVVERIKQRLKNNFNISIVEEPSNKWQIAELFCVCANYEKQTLGDILNGVENFARSNPDINILEINKGTM